uniref:Proline rich 5 n=2 Tax=Sinocyclocheilus grahami TaxID=75366 RepID=A0A672NV29_SINGR
MWDFFFCDVLSMLQAIFYPVQGKEPSVRQLALLHFRNTITLNIKLDDALTRPRARVPASIIQMLLILQGVHESKGVSSDYLKLECLVQKVVSPYLGTHGLFSGDGSVAQSSCVLEKRLLRRWPRSKSYNMPMLTPVAEYDPESSAGAGARRHSVCQMTSCAEEPDVCEDPSPPIVDQILESLDSDAEGIFIDFCRQRSSSSDFSRESESAA